MRESSSYWVPGVRVRRKAGVDMGSRLASLVVFSLSLVALCFSAGCGGGDPGGGDGGDGTDPLDATIQAANAVDQSFRQACDGAAWPTGSAGFIAAAQANPEVETAVVDEATGDASVRYRSGVIHILHHCNRPETGTGTSLDSLLEEAGVRDIGSAPVAPRWFPSQDTPRATAASPYDENGLYAAIQDSCQRVLDSAHVAGYQVPGSVPTATVDWFRSWAGCGVVYYAGHGGRGQWHTDDGDVPIYALTTAERFDVADGIDPAHAEDLAEGRIVLFSADKDEDGAAEMRVLGVTHRFFEHYCNPMASHGIVWINSCNSMTYYTDLAAPLCAMGTEVVFGWSGPAPVRLSTAWTVWAFDRMGGLNSTQPLDPPTRPFIAEAVWAELESRGWNHFVTSDGRECNLEYYRPTIPDDERTALRPVIDGGVFHAENELSQANVWLNGYFGRSRGQVFVDDTPLSISTWEPFYVQGDFPRGTTDLVGDVYVRVNHLDSNRVPLTHFSGGFDVDVERPGRYEGTIQAVFDGRVLLHQIRADIDGTPVTMPTPSGYAMFQPETWELTWNISGEWDTISSLGVPHHCSLAAAGSYNDQDDPGQLVQAFQMDLDAHTVRRRLSINHIDGTITCTGADGTTTSDWIIGLETGGLLAAEPLPADWDIAERSYSGTTEGDILFEVNWTHIAPDIPPPTGAAAYPSSIRGARMLGRPS